MVEEIMITIGKITKNQGNKGEVRVFPLTNSLERFQLLEEVYLFKGNKTLKKEIESMRFHKNFVILKFKDINDLDSALKLRDFQVRISKEELLALEDNEYYIDDLIGFTVYTHEEEFLGNISDVIVTGGTDVFIVKGSDKEYMIPAALELITEVNELDKKMIINPIPGLLEL